MARIFRAGGAARAVLSSSSEASDTARKELNSLLRIIAFSPSVQQQQGAAPLAAAPSCTSTLQPQNMNFVENCMIRGVPTILVICPKVELFMLVSGPPKFVWLSKLNVSHRIWIDLLSLILKVRLRAVSTLKNEGLSTPCAHDVPKVPRA